jgi:hypothetical protein
MFTLTIDHSVYLLLAPNLLFHPNTFLPRERERERERERLRLEL